VPDDTKAASNLQKVTALLILAEQVGQAQVALETAIGQKNGEIGLQVVLRQKAVHQRERRAIDQVLDSTKYLDNTAIEGNQVESYFARMVDTLTFKQAQVKVLDAATTERLGDRSKLLKHEIDKLGDQMHELNASHKLTVDFAKDVIDLLGL
jgi:hypothetical protein